MTVMQAQDLLSILTTPVARGDVADLRGVEVTDSLDLQGTDITSVDFSGARFRSKVSFRQARLQGLSWFKDCVFEAGLDCTGTLFTNDARFDAAVFHGPLAFAGAELRGASDFSRCRFMRQADFAGAVFYGNLSFEAARFSGSTILNGVECLGGLWSDGAAFDGTVEARHLDVHGRAWLKGVRMAKSPGRAPDALAARMTAYGYQWL
jgi:uncharacterized protein YjbI with pentapeptide repeats